MDSSKYPLRLNDISRDDHYYQIQSDRSRVAQEKDTINKAYQALVEEHRQLQASLDDIKLEKEEALTQARQAAADADRRRDDRAEPAFKAEIDRLRLEL
jgi:protein HOOK3